MLKGMLMKKMSLLVFILVTLEVIAQTPSKVQKTAGNSPVKPRLVVAIIADQFRYDYLLRYGSEYSEGLKQLMTRGAVFTNAHYEHFPTFTSVGHAAFLSGALPSVTGIIGNSWYDRYTGKPVQSASDSSVQQVGGAGGPGSSPRNLLVRHHWGRTEDSRREPKPSVRDFAQGLQRDFGERSHGRCGLLV